LQQLENQAYLEQQQESGNKQLDLFFAKTEHPAMALLAEVNPDDLTPKQALTLLYKLNELL
jgi:DNA mismatch repair protein MutS